MATKVLAVGVQREGDKVVGTFAMSIEGKPDAITFRLPLEPNATQGEIGQAVAAKCVEIAAQQPPNALTVLETMIANRSQWTIPDPKPADQAAE